MTLAQVLVFGLATWRIASLLADEEGVFNFFEKIRQWIGIVYESDQVHRYGKNELAKNVLCTWCNSLFIGGFWMILYLWVGKWALYAAAPFAFSTISIWVEKRVWVGHKR